MAYTYKLKTKTFNVVCELNAPETLIASPRRAVAAFRAFFASLDEYQEHFAIATINAKCAITGYKILSSGTETACLVSPAMIMRAALVLGGTSVLLCHNHPSGDPSPSREDRLLTERCRQAGEILGLSVADHIILGAGNAFTSFRMTENWED